MTSSIRHLGRHLFPLLTKEIKTYWRSLEGANRRLDFLSSFLTFEPSDHPFVQAITVHQSIHWFAYSSIHSFIHPSIHPSLLSVHQSNYPFIHSSIHLFVYQPIHSLTFSSIHPSIHFFINPSIHPSIHPCPSSWYFTLILN